MDLTRVAFWELRRATGIPDATEKRFLVLHPVAARPRGPVRLLATVWMRRVAMIATWLRVLLPPEKTRLPRAFRGFGG